MHRNWLFEESVHVTLASTDKELPEDGVTELKYVRVILM